MAAYKGQSRDIGFTITGLDETVRRLERLGTHAVHAKPALEAVGELILHEEAARWGKGWAKNAPATVEKKGDGRVGVESGDLEKSFTERGAKWNIFRVLDGELTVGSSAPHAHLFDRGREGQPRRKAIRLRKPTREAMAKVVLDWIVRHTR